MADFEARSQDFHTPCQAELETRPEGVVASAGIISRIAEVDFSNHVQSVQKLAFTLTRGCLFLIEFAGMYGSTLNISAQHCAATAAFEQIMQDHQPQALSE